jgi:hypothetical protein
MNDGHLPHPAEAGPGRPAGGGIIGSADRFLPAQGLIGWAFEPGCDEPLRVSCRLAGREIGTAVADRPRADLPQFRSGAVGFVLPVPAEVRPAELAGGVELHALREGRDLGPLPQTPLLRADLARHAAFVEVAQALAVADDEQRRDAVRHLADAVALAGADPDMLAGLGAFAENLARANRVLATPAAPAGAAVTPVLLPVGTMAGDGSALLGRDGFAFLTGGSNKVAALYGRGSPDADTGFARRWIGLIRDRRAAAADAGARFLQVVMPEKQTLHPGAFPAPLLVPTPLLEAVEQGIAAAPDLAPAYLSGRAVLAHCPPELVLRRLDTHLTPRGMFTVLGAIAERLGLVPPAPRRFAQPWLRAGDLSRRFLGVPLFETVLEAEELPGFAARAERVEQILPASGRHHGSRESWRNPAAPYDLHVLVFGVSCFGLAAHQGNLSWWMARWFRRYDFLWSDGPDAELSARLKPDVIICHTVERFMRTLPPA